MVMKGCRFKPGQGGLLKLITDCNPAVAATSKQALSSRQQPAGSIQQAVYRQQLAGSSSQVVASRLFSST